MIHRRSIELGRIIERLNIVSQVRACFTDSQLLGVLNSIEDRLNEDLKDKESRELIENLVVSTTTQVADFTLVLDYLSWVNKNDKDAGRN